MSDRYWYCLIGPVQDELVPKDGDFHPRMAAREAVEQMTGVDTVNKTASGWLDNEEALALKLSGLI